MALDDPDSPFLACSAEPSFLQSTEWQQVINDGNPPICIVIGTKSWRRIEDSLGDVRSFHERVPDRFWGGRSSIHTLCSIFELRMISFTEAIALCSAWICFLRARSRTLITRSTSSLAFLYRLWTGSPLLDTETWIAIEYYHKVDPGGGTAP